MIHWLSTLDVCVRLGLQCRKNDDNGNGKGGNVARTHENEGSDRKTIAFPPGQLSLAASLSAKHTGTPLVCVLVHGGSLAPATLMRDCDALVDLWCTRSTPFCFAPPCVHYPYCDRSDATPARIVALTDPGDMGASALADVLFGRVSPAGRTSQTWYESDAAMPAQGLMTLRPAADGSSSGWTYRYHNKRPAIPFGFGLSCEAD